MKTILLVDDDEHTLQMLRSLFASEDHRVILARNGIEALTQISVNPVDLVVTDLSMPGMDGVTLCQILRADPIHELLPIVLMSGAEAPAEEGLWNAFFRKPVSWSLVEQTVRGLFASQRGHVTVANGARAQRATPERQLGSMVLEAGGGEQPRSANAEENP